MRYDSKKYQFHTEMHPQLFFFAAQTVNDENSKAWDFKINFNPDLDC